MNYLIDPSKIFNKTIWLKFASQINNFKEIDIDIYVLSDSYYYNGLIYSSANGYEPYKYNPLMSTQFGKLRYPETNKYYQLMGCFGPSDLDINLYDDIIDSKSFIIGTSNQIKINSLDQIKINDQTIDIDLRTNNTLYIFANDFKYFYWNNNLIRSNMHINIMVSVFDY
jgi:hypothetical protein